MRCRYLLEGGEFCAREATIAAELSDDHCWPLCAEHYEACIQHAVRAHAGAYPEEVVRSCMERASCPIPPEATH